MCVKIIETVAVSDCTCRFGHFNMFAFLQSFLKCVTPQPTSLAACARDLCRCKHICGFKTESIRTGDFADCNRGACIVDKIFDIGACIVDKIFDIRTDDDDALSGFDHSGGGDLGGGGGGGLGGDLRICTDVLHVKVAALGTLNGCIISSCVCSSVRRFDRADSCALEFVTNGSGGTSLLDAWKSCSESEPEAMPAQLKSAKLST